MLKGSISIKSHAFLFSFGYFMGWGVVCLKEAASRMEDYISLRVKFLMSNDTAGRVSDEWSILVELPSNLMWK